MQSNLANLNLSTAVMQRSVRVGVLYPGRSVAIMVSWWFASAPNYIISLGVGWLALLILGKRQCESPTAGIGAEEQTPTSFLFPQAKALLTLNLGVRRHKDFLTL